MIRQVLSLNFCNSVPGDRIRFAQAKVIVRQPG